MKRKQPLERFKMAIPELNLVANILKQAWVDALEGEKKVKITADVVNWHETIAMFEGNSADEWRKSLSYLADVMQVDDEVIVRAYKNYKEAKAKGKKVPNAEKAFEILLKILMSGQGETRKNE